MKILTRAALGTLAAVLLCILIAIALPAAKASADENEFKCWAVFIGLSEYQTGEPSPGGSEGATRFHETISAIWGEERCLILTNEEATKNKIQEALAWLADNTGENDTVLFYYAGHGTYGGYFSAYNSVFVDTWISTTELKLWLQGITSARMVVILDSCLSGRFNPTLSQQGRVILSSSRNTEFSYILPIGGIFTLYLLYVIDDFINYGAFNDSSLTVEELFELAEPETIAQTTAYADTIQHPVMSDEYDGELSLLVHFVLASNPVVPDPIKIYNVDGEDHHRTSILTWAPGSTHDIEILTPVETGQGTRYLFNSWEDGLTSPIRAITAGGKYTVNFDKQYLLEIISDFGNPEGQGWYAEDAVAMIFIESIDEPSEKHHFISWSGDYSGDENSAEINMDMPKTITANWHTEYLLNIESKYGEPTGARWYDEDDIATIEIESVETTDARHHFNGWTGDYTGNENSFEISMDSPKSVTAGWQSEYLLSIESDHGKPDGVGWYDEGDIAQVSIESVGSPDAIHHFIGWSGDYTGNENDFEITVDSPKSITANWHSEYQISISSDYGKPKGEGWYDEGATATISVPDSNGFLIRKVFDGWIGDFNGTSATAQIEIENAMSITAQWRTDFLQLYILVGVLVITTVMTFFIIRRRRRTTAI